jgi:thioesterase domain-containing protein
LQMDVAESARAESFVALVDLYLQRVLALQPQGTYRLLGWSLGGGFAQALAAKLQARGKEVALLALLDCYPAAAWSEQPQPSFDDALRTLLGVNGDFDTEGVSTEALLQRLQRAGSPFAGLGTERLDQWAHESLRQMQMFRSSETSRFDGPTVFYRAQRNPPQMPHPEAWAELVPNVAMNCVGIDCTHDGMSDPRPMALIGTDLARRIEGSV